MAIDKTNSAAAHVPNLTLGRTGYEGEPTDRLYERANQLDALLSVLVGSSDQEAGLFAFNEEIQRAVLSLASSLASEINGLQDQLLHANMRKRDESRSPAAH